MSKVKVNSLSDLKLVRREIEAQAKQRAQEAAERARLARLAEAEKNLFARAAGEVTPLPDKRTVLLKKTPPPPLAQQHALDEASALQESLSDAFDASNLLDTDEHLSFRRPGVGPDVTRKLRLGHWRIQRELDLHGLRTEDARESLGQFIREARQLGLRCVRVVHGKGLGSPGKTPVLKNRVHSWLAQKNDVIAFVQARPADGGAGALVVLLSPSITPSTPK
jgi:DNA-nicking Smr family endonuclease